jgi:signal transduction histidine kinase
MDHEGAMPSHAVATLVVDDDPVIRRTISRYLSKEGHAVTEAGDGLEGLKRYSANKPGLVLLDLSMPRMGGMEVLARIAADDPDLPVVVISGAGGLDDALKALRSGAWDYLTKPLTDMGVLGHTVAKVLERARLLRENRKHQLFLEQEVRRRTLELERANKELVSAQQHLWVQLEQAQRMESLGMLAGGIAHDFNNILASILFSAEMVLETQPEDTPQREDLERIVRVSERGKSLVGRILSYTRAASRRRGRFPVAPAVEETVQFFKPLLPSTIELSIEIDPQAGTVEGDPTQVQQMVMNLVTNAVHALRQTNAPKLCLSVRNVPGPSRRQGGRGAGKGGERIEISVRDNGQGIRPEDLERIFVPRFTTKGDTEGSGLGLYVVRELVAEHKGEIVVESEPGKGTMFTISLPVLGAQLKRKKNSVPSAARKGGETILVAEDDGELSESLVRLLGTLGYRVILAGDGQEALERIESLTGTINLAILDQEMPRLSGTAVCRELMERAPTVPVLLLTGRLEVPQETLMQTGNVRGVLFKPVGKGQLAEAIRGVLDKQGKGQA